MIKKHGRVKRTKRRTEAVKAEPEKIEKAVMKALEKEEATVEQLVATVSSNLAIDKYLVARALYKLREKGDIVILDPNPPRRLISYLLSSRSTWFWLLAALISLTNITIYLLPPEPPFIYARYVLGALFVLYLPGASLIELLYPSGKDLSQLERLALSLGLSLALVPLVGLILNYTPWGISLDPIVAALTLLTLTLSLGAVARKHAYHLLTHREAFLHG